MIFEPNHMTQEVTCITESVYSGALTYGQVYEIIAWDTNKRQIKIRGDNQRTRWFPEFCFTPGHKELSKFVRIVSMDSIQEHQRGSTEVTIELSTNQQRWCFFITPEGLASLGGEQDFSTGQLLSYNAPHMIIVSTLSRQIIEQVLRYIESQGELLNCTKQV